MAETCPEKFNYHPKMKGKENVGLSITEVIFNVVNFINPLLYTIRHPALRTKTCRIFRKIYPEPVQTCNYFATLTCDRCQSLWCVI